MKKRKESTKQRILKRRGLDKVPSGMSYKETKDGSIYQGEKIIFFSPDKFIKDILENDNCFICGTKKTKSNFNDEHIIPDWILRKKQLFSSFTNLPNGESRQYDRYKIPCCKKCNSLLGKKIEEPMSKLLSSSYEEITKYIIKNGPNEIFVWLSLIFFKYHYKDKDIRLYKDLRKPNIKLSDYVNWLDMHHIHCILRSPYTKPEVDLNVLGSFLILPVSDKEDTEEFDYCDHPSGSILLRLNDVCFISILNDSRICQKIHKEELNKISSGLTTLQLREIFCRMTYTNLRIKKRPEYYSGITTKDTYRISVKIPKNIELKDIKNTEYGKILNKYCSPIIEKFGGEDKNKIIKAIKKGYYSFLFDKNRKFIKN